MKRAVAMLALAVAAGRAAGGPHEHGVGELLVALEGRTLTIELRLPAKDLVGFERAPRTDAERARIETAGKALADAGLFTPSSAAACVIAGAPDVHVPKFAGKTADEDHADFEAAYRFECADPAALAALDHAVFKTFPKVKQLRAQAVTAKGQRQATLTHGRPRLSF